MNALGFELEIELAPLMVLFRYDDVPGVIGRVGTLFGEHGVNIANMAVSRTREGGKALMALSLDLERAAGARRRACAARASTTPASSTSADSGRGGRWVVAQFVLIAAVIAAGFLPPGWPDGASAALGGVGAALSLLSAVAVASAWRSLERAATPYPRPREGGRLIEAGPYRYLRHPIYAAGLLFFAGFALATSPTAFVPLVALALLWKRKAAREEDLLVERYPDYRDYRSRVPGAFVPRPAR